MASITLTPGVGFYYVGGDYTAAGIENSVVETEVLDYVIPADTVLHGIYISVYYNMQMNRSDAPNTGILRIKAGADGAEATYLALTWKDGRILGTLEGNTGGAGYEGQFNEVRYVIDDLDWSLARSVSITIQFGFAHLQNYGSGFILLITGF